MVRTEQVFRKENFIYSQYRYQISPNFEIRERFKKYERVLSSYLG